MNDMFQLEIFLLVLFLIAIIAMLIVEEWAFALAVSPYAIGMIYFIYDSIKDGSWKED